MSTLWKIVIAVAATLIIVGGGTYYFMNRAAVAEKDKLQDQINDLQGEIDDSQTVSTATNSASQTTTESAGNTSGLKEYKDKEGFVSFSYPANWSVVEKYGIGEGSGISELTINFAVANTDNIGTSVLNEMTVVLYPRREASTQSFNDVFVGVNENLTDAKKSAYKIGGVDGFKYSDLGGLASNPTKYIVKSDNKYILTVEDTNDLGGNKAAAVSESAVDQILSSFTFTK